MISIAAGWAYNGIHAVLAPGKRAIISLCVLWLVHSTPLLTTACIQLYITSYTGLVTMQVIVYKHAHSCVICLFAPYYATWFYMLLPLCCIITTRCQVFTTLYAIAWCCTGTVSCALCKCTWCCTDAVPCALCQYTIYSKCILNCDTVQNITVCTIVFTIPFCFAHYSLYTLNYCTICYVTVPSRSLLIISALYTNSDQKICSKTSLRMLTFCCLS